MMDKASDGYYHEDESPVVPQASEKRMAPVVNPMHDTAPPVAEPTSGELRIRMALAIGMPVFYFALLLLLHVFWLAYDHPDLKDICTIGDGIFASATSLIIGHYIGSQTTVSAVNTGVQLEPMNSSRR